MASMSATVSASASSLTSETMIEAPSVASRRAMARPIPAPAAVTRATWFLKNGNALISGENYCRTGVVLWSYADRASRRDSQRRSNKATKIAATIPMSVKMTRSMVSSNPRSTSPREAKINSMGVKASACMR